MNTNRNINITQTINGEDSEAHGTITLEIRLNVNLNRSLNSYTSAQIETIVTNYFNNIHSMNNGGQVADCRSALALLLNGISRTGTEAINDVINANLRLQRRRIAAGDQEAAHAGRNVSEEDLYEPDGLPISRPVTQEEYGPPTPPNEHHPEEEERRRIEQDEAYERGREQGHRDTDGGYKEGERAGYQEGFNDGLNSVTNSNNSVPPIPDLKVYKNSN